MCHLAALASTRAGSRRANGSRGRAILAEERAEELVERLTVAAPDHARRHRRHRRSPRDIHGERDLAEVLPGAEDPPATEGALRDRGQSREKDVEALAIVSLADDRGPGRHLVPAHAVRELRQRLAWKLGEEADARQLRHARRYMSRRHGNTVLAMGLLKGWQTCPRCGERLAGDERTMSCEACGSQYYAHSAPAAAAVVVDESGRVLLARRKSEPYAGRWDMPGGFLEEGEDPLQAIRRELAEETGLEVEPEHFVGAFVDDYGDPESGSVLNLAWTAKVLHGEMAPDDDVSELRWFAPDELPADDSEYAFHWVAPFLRRWAETRLPGMR
jgi:8-oxo-dGTP diphosphatase